MNIERLVKFTAVTVGLLCFVGVARGQTAPPWNENRITWGAPTHCASGRPVSECPVSGYLLERSTTPTGTFTPLASLPATVLAYAHRHRGGAELLSRHLCRAAAARELPAHRCCLPHQRRAARWPAAAYGSALCDHRRHQRLPPQRYAGRVDLGRQPPWHRVRSRAARPRHTRPADLHLPQSVVLPRRSRQQGSLGHEGHHELGGAVRGSGIRLCRRPRKPAFTSTMVVRCWWGEYVIKPRKPQ
jgi:hypothetical protein